MGDNMVMDRQPLQPAPAGVPAGINPPLPALSLRSVDVERGGHKVLHDITLDVPAGSLVGLVGLNGAGKTSLIKAVLGLAGHFSGEIRIFGKPAATMRGQGEIAYLPEQFRPPGGLRGRAYARLMRDLEAEPEKAMDAVAMATRLDLDPAALERPVRGWSKGMCQKLGLAVTLASPARLLLLDEPMSGLDPLARARLKEVLLEARNAGRTLVVCSHGLADLDEMADRIAIIHRGRLLACGDTAGLRGSYPTLERAFLDLVDSSEAVGRE